MAADRNSMKKFYLVHNVDANVTLAQAFDNYTEAYQYARQMAATTPNTYCVMEPVIVIGRAAHPATNLTIESKLKNKEQS